MMVMPMSMPRKSKELRELGPTSHSKLRAKPSEEWGGMISDLWGALYHIWLPALTGVREPKTDSLGHFVFYACSAEEIFSEVSRSRGERCKHLTLPPTNVPIQLALVLLKEVGHFVSQHITFMWSHLSLLENEVTNSFQQLFPFCLKCVLWWW